MMAACRGGVKLARASLAGEGAQQAAELSDSLCAGEELSDDQVKHMRTLLSVEPESVPMELAQAAVGGDTARLWLFQGAPAEQSFNDQLAALENTLAAKIQGHQEAVFMSALERVGRKAADLVKRGGASGSHPVEWLDAQPVRVVRAALTDLDEAKAVDAVSDLQQLVAASLDAGALSTARLWSKRTGRSIAPAAVMNEMQRDTAVGVAMLSVTALVMGRLARADGIVDATVPPNISRDVLHVAGGADSSPLGGVPRTDDGRVLVNGVESKGNGFTTSQQMLETAAPEAETVLVWKHSANADPNEVHQRNDGKEQRRCDFRAGPPGGARGCGCKWETKVIGI